MYPLKYFEEFEEYLVAWGIAYYIIKQKKTETVSTDYLNFV